MRDRQTGRLSEVFCSTHYSETPPRAYELRNTRSTNFFPFSPRDQRPNSQFNLSVGPASVRHLPPFVREKS